MPVVRLVSMFDMTADSDTFMTAEQLVAEGWEPVCYPPCDYHSPDDIDGAAHPGVEVRPRDRSLRWMWYGTALDRRLGYDPNTRPDYAARFQAVLNG